MCDENRRVKQLPHIQVPPSYARSLHVTHRVRSAATALLVRCARGEALPPAVVDRLHPRLEALDNALEDFAHAGPLLGGRLEAVRFVLRGQRVHLLLPNRALRELLVHQVDLGPHEAHVAALLRLLDHLLDPLALDAVEGRPVCEIVADYCGSSATAVEAGERVEALLSCRVLRRQPKLSGASSGHAAAGRVAHPDAKVARPSVHLHLLHRKGRPDGLRGARRGAGQLAAAARRSECRENRVAPRTEIVSPNVL